MAHTYTQLYIHCVFAVKYRQGLLHPDWDEDVRRYLTGVVEHQHHKMIAVNNMPDHLHLLFGLNPAQSISDLIRDVKGESSAYINERKLTPQTFRWQEGFGAFSHSRSQLPRVARYIENQQEHHAKKTFLQEYRRILDQCGTPYDERTIFLLPE